MAGSDDMNLSFLDFSTGQIVHSLKKAHNDFVRSVMPFHGNESLSLSGGYDKIVKLIDLRETEKFKMVFKHDAELEDLKMYNSDINFVSVGGKITKIWDIRKNDEALASLTHNIKSVNSAFVSEEDQRIFTGSIDGMVKVYDLNDVRFMMTISTECSIKSSIRSQSQGSHFRRT